MKTRTKPRPRKAVEGKPQHAAFVPGRLHIRFKADALRGAASALAHGVRAPRTMSASDPRVRELRAALPTQVTDPLRLLAEQFGVRRITPLIVPAEQQRRVARQILTCCALPRRSSGTSRRSRKPSARSSAANAAPRGRIETGYSGSSRLHQARNSQS
jgi:hypothetical protein